MKREVCKFLSGAFAGLAYAHAGYAVATSTGIVDEPVFLGRRWGVGFMWTEAVVYSAISLALGYAGWLAEPEAQLQTSKLSTGDGQEPHSVRSAEPAQPVSR